MDKGWEYIIRNTVLRMRQVIKPKQSWSAGRALLASGVIVTLLIAFYAVPQWQQYQRYGALTKAIAPVLTLVQELDAGSATQLTLSSDQTRRINQFIAVMQSGGYSDVEKSQLLGPLQLYQQHLEELQDLSLHNHYALQAFANALRGLDGQSSHYSEYQALLAQSQLYINAPTIEYLSYLDKMAAPLRASAEEKSQEALYYYQQYRQSLEQVIQLRQLITTYKSTALYDYYSRWQAQQHHYGQHLIKVVVLLLLLYLGGIIMGLLLRNRQLRQASEASLTVARTKADFLANMSHEIRTPMNAIIGFSALLKNTNLTRQQGEYLKKITHSSDSLLLLINDILDLSKVEAGKLELERVEFNLDELLERWSGLFADLSDQKQLEIIIDKATTVPSYWYGDPLRIGQVIVNLVSNAVKFTERGQVVLRIFTKADPELLLCFSVQDTGIGIVPQQLDRLFHAFTQVDASTTRKYGGSGLGLSISQRLVQLMHGTITVNSQPGLGSTFIVCLPLAPSERVLAKTLEQPFVGKRALLVESNPQAQQVLDRLLGRLGFEVFKTTDSRQAKTQLQKRGTQLDLALINCRFDYNDGLALIEYIREQPQFSQLPIVLTSAFSHAHIQAEVGHLAVDYYLPKPITEYGLRASLQPLLEPTSATTAPPSAQMELEYYRAKLRGKHILLVEDNRLNQELIKEFLVPMNVQLQVADQGRHALELIAKHRFDVILMDLQMPIMGGIEATRQIRKLPTDHNIPIIALTASAMREDREAGLQAGMNAYVTKPIHRLNLYRTLSSALYPDVEVNPARGSMNLIASESRNTQLVASSSSEPEHTTFIAQHQDDIWLLKGLLARENWSEAHSLVAELATQAQSYGLVALAEVAQELLPPLHQQQRPTAEQLEKLAAQISQLTG